MSDVALASLEVYHSRPVAPTRRVALGVCRLSSTGALPAGALLLGAVVGKYLPACDDELREDLAQLICEIARGERIRQPRLRHRLQHDRIGLTRSAHSLRRKPDGSLFVDSEDRCGTPPQHILGAVYAASGRHLSIRAVSETLRWRGGEQVELIDFLKEALRARYGFSYGASKSSSEGSAGDPSRCREEGHSPYARAWALEVMGYEFPYAPDPREQGEIQQRFRRLVATAHPDGGGSESEAAIRISELLEARRILLG